MRSSCAAPTPASCSRALGVDEASHAFYLGRELERAALAVRLGKKYVQESPLRWGYLSAADDTADPAAGAGVTRVVGIDPGTVSVDVCGRDGDAVFLDESFPTAAIGADPGMLVELLQGAGPLDLVVGPSGYGLPWTDVRDVGAGELELLFLADAADGPRGTILGGMGRLVEALRASGLPVCFSPSVAHLPTVPAHRKVNRIDMGTADKLCAVALGVWDQARRLRLPCDATSFVFVEVGGAFTAVISVDGGAVVDGAGGTSGAPGFRAMGAMDGELAYLLRDFSKDVLASGGAAWVCGDPACAPDDLVTAAAAGGRAAVALDALLEGVEKQVAAQVTVLGTPREILLSGRLSRVPAIRRLLAERLSRFAPVQRRRRLRRRRQRGGAGRRAARTGTGRATPTCRTSSTRCRCAPPPALSWIISTSARPSLSGAATRRPGGRRHPSGKGASLSCISTEWR